MPDSGQVIGRISVRVMPDTSKFRSSTQRELTKIQRQLKDLKVQLDIDKTHLNRLKKELRDWARGISPLKIQVKPELLTGAATLVNARLRAVSRPRTVEIIPQINNAALANVATALAALSGARALHSIFDTLYEKLINLDKAVPLIGALALAVAGLAGWGIAAASNLAALSAALAQIAPAALALPGIFGGMAIGLGATVAVLKDFTTVFPQVSAQLSALQDRMSANFWSAARAPIQELISTLLPQFSAGIAHVSSHLGTFFGQLATAFTGTFDGALAGMFDDLTASIDIASEASEGLASIFATLGSVGAGYLPRLAQWFVDITNSFDAWLSGAAADGRLDDWIDTALMQLTALGDVIKHLSSTFAGIGRAATAGGGSSLGAMADTLGRVAAVVNSPAFQATLTNVFATAHEMMSNIASGAGPQLERLFTSLANTFTTLGPLIGATLGVALGAIAGALADPAIQRGIEALIVAMSAAVSALAPAMAPLAGVIGLIAQVAGQLLAALGPIAAVLIEALATAFTAILPALMPVVDILGGALLQIVTALAPLLGLLGMVIGELLTAITPLLPVLINLVTAILTPLIDIVMQIVMAVLPPLVAAITGLVAALTPVLTVIAAFANWLLDLLAPAIVWVGEVVIGAFIDIINAIKDVFKGVTSYVMGVWNVFAGLFTGDWSRMWTGIQQVWTGIWDAIKGAFVLILAFLGGSVLKGALKGITSLWGNAWSAIKRIALELWDSIKGRWGSFLDDLKAAPGNALDAIKKLFRGAFDDVRAAVELLRKGVVDTFRNASTLLHDAGKKIIDGLIRGIKSMVGKVKGTLNSITNLIPDWKGPASEDRNLLVDAGRMVMDGFINGLESRYGMVRRSLAELTKDVASTEFAIPGATGGIHSRLAAALDGAEQEAVVQKILNYHAAPGSSLSSEEDLFKAAGRARMVGW